MKLIGLLLLVLSFNAWAEVATTVAIRGQVFANEVQLFQGTKINKGETIVVADKSFAVFLFTDGAKLTVRPNSTVVITEYSYEAEKEAAEFNLVAGGLRIITGAIAKEDPENYKVRTPVALMGVRGTEFSIQLVDDTYKIEEYGGF